MKRYLLLGIAATTLFWTLSVQAGLKSGYEVIITTSGTVTTAAGSIGKARNSADSVQYIFCYSRNNNFGYCAARTSSSVYKACLTTDTNLIAVIQSVSIGTHLSFKVEDGSTTCTTVQSVNGSHIQPAVP